MPWSPVAKAPAPSKEDARVRDLILRGRVNYLLGHSQQKAIYKAAKDSNMLPQTTCAKSSYSKNNILSTSDLGKPPLNIVLLRSGVLEVDLQRL